MILFTCRSHKTCCGRLEVMQNNACRLILRCPKLTHVTDMLHTLKLQSLYYRRDLHISLFMYKVLNENILNKQIICLFGYLEDTRPQQTRASTNHDVVVNKYRTLFGRKSIKICGAIKWNALHSSLETLKTFPAFKTLYPRLYPL